MTTHIELQVIDDKHQTIIPAVFNKSEIKGIIADNGSGTGITEFTYEGETIRVKCSYEFLRDNLC